VRSANELSAGRAGLSHPFLIPAMSEIHSGSSRGIETEMGK